MKNKKILIFLIFILILGILIINPQTVNAADEEGNLVIVLDPGHGGGDPGAIGGELREDQVNFKIAYYAKQELERYEGVKVYLTRYNNCPTIYERVEIAKKYNADLLLSLHINAGNGNSRGAAIWVTQDDTEIEYYEKAAEVSEKILYNISKIGIINNGVKTRSGRADEWYDSGVVQDYYGIIRYAQKIKLRSILIEHCFIDNYNDRQFINNDEKIKKIAQADVKGIVETYQLVEKNQGFEPVRFLEFEQPELVLEIKDTDLQPVSYINTIFTPNYATNKEIEWYSTNPETVRVWNGRIRGLKEGEATIKAISKNNQRLATCKVIVNRPKVALESINTDQTEQTVEIDQVGDIIVKFNPENCDDQTLFWNSSNPEVVRIWRGHFRGLKEGSSVITAVTRAGGKKISCVVKVKDPNKIYVEDIKCEREEYITDIDEAVNLPYRIEPSNSENAEFEWSSSDSEILRVSGNRYRGLKEGTAYVIVRTKDNMFEKRIKVTVENLNKPYVQKVQTDKEKYTIDIDEAVDLDYSYMPINSKNAEFIWSSSDPEILRVWNNRFRGLKEGIAEVIVKTLDGRYEKRIEVVVNDPNKRYVEDIQFEKEEYTILEDEAIDLPYTVLPNNSINAELEWSSSNPGILRVWNNRFRGLKEGTAYVIVKTKDGRYEKRIKVIIKDPNKIYVEDIQFEKEEYTIVEDEAVDLPYTVLPKNSVNAELEWSSSNPEILRVWHNRFRGLKEGTAYVIVKTKDGRYEKRIKVIIEDSNKIYVEDIEFEKEEYIILEDEAIDLPYTILPQNSTNTELEWSSSDPNILRVWHNRFRGLKEGTAYVIVNTTDGTYEKRLKVIIRDPDKKYVEDIIFDKQEYNINIDEAVDIPFEVTPQDSVNAEFEWSSSNPEILRVWHNRFRGLKEGTAYVIVKTKDGTFQKKIIVNIEEE